MTSIFPNTQQKKLPLSYELHKPWGASTKQKLLWQSFANCNSNTTIIAINELSLNKAYYSPKTIISFISNAVYSQSTPYEEELQTMKKTDENRVTKPDIAMNITSS
jgi:hypothetical protein